MVTHSHIKGESIVCLGMKSESSEGKEQNLPVGSRLLGYPKELEFNHGIYSFS